MNTVYAAIIFFFLPAVPPDYDGCLDQLGSTFSELIKCDHKLAVVRKDLPVIEAYIERLEQKQRYRKRRILKLEQRIKQLRKKR